MTRRSAPRLRAAAAAALAAPLLAGCGGDLIHREDFDRLSAGDTPNGPSPGPPPGDENRTDANFGAVSFGPGMGLQIARIGPNPERHAYEAVPAGGRVGADSGYAAVFSAIAETPNPDPMLARLRSGPFGGFVLAEIRFQDGGIEALDGTQARTLDVAYDTGDVLEVSLDLDVDAGTYDAAVINTDHRPTDPKARSDELTGLALGAQLRPGDDRPYLQLTFADEGGGRSGSVFRVDDVRLTER
jgi:hypothetical protein